MTIEEFMPIYGQLSKEKDVGGYADFMEAMLVFDKESNGTIIAAELRHLLLSLGEKMTEAEVDEILKLCSNEDTEGNTRYEGKTATLLPRENPEKLPGFPDGKLHSREIPHKKSQGKKTSGPLGVYRKKQWRI